MTTVKELEKDMEGMADLVDSFQERLVELEEQMAAIVRALAGQGISLNR